MLRPGTNYQVPVKDHVKIYPVGSSQGWPFFGLLPSPSATFVLLKRRISVDTAGSETASSP